MPKKGGRPKGSKDKGKRKSGSGRHAGGAAKAPKTTGDGVVPTQPAPRAPPPSGSSPATRPPPMRPAGRPAWAERMTGDFPGSSTGKTKSTGQVQTGLGENPKLRPLVEALSRRPAGFDFRIVPDGAIDRAKTAADVLIRERNAGCIAPTAPATPATSAAPAAPAAPTALVAGGESEVGTVQAGGGRVALAQGTRQSMPAVATPPQPFLPTLGQQIEYVNNRKRWLRAEVIAVYRNVAAGEAPYATVKMRNNKTLNKDLSQMRPRSLAPDDGAIDDLVIDGPRGSKMPPYAPRPAICYRASSLYVAIDHYDRPTRRAGTSASGSRRCRPACGVRCMETSPSASPRRRRRSRVASQRWHALAAKVIAPGNRIRVHHPVHSLSGSLYTTYRVCNSDATIGGHRWWRANATRPPGVPRALLVARGSV
jgi:hypothetical protein